MWTQLTYIFLLYITECGLWKSGLERGARGISKHTDVKWPSLAILLHTSADEKSGIHPRDYACTASVLSPTWLITAYSCLQSKWVLISLTHSAQWHSCLVEIDLVKMLYPELNTFLIWSWLFIFKLYTFGFISKYKLLKIYPQIVKIWLLNWIYTPNTFLFYWYHYKKKLI